MTLADAIHAAEAADTAFDHAIMAEGYKSRWDWDRHEPSSERLVEAYRAKLSADTAMHAAFEAQRAGTG